jgi:hypothetical protein
MRRARVFVRVRAPGQDGAAQHNRTERTLTWGMLPALHPLGRDELVLAGAGQLSKHPPADCARSLTSGIVTDVGQGALRRRAGAASYSLAPSVAPDDQKEKCE